ncbi:MAG: iron ABC transporter permease [Bacteroidales bacterium]|nr:iron ABC transporter permease [Bacteroidales bacterium]
MTDLIHRKYKHYIRRKLLFLLAVIVLLVVFFFIGLSMGSINIHLKNILYSLTGLADYQDSVIVLNIRLPRILSAIVAGIALSVSGAAMQSLLRNPLASPVSLGISHGAAFGAAFAIIVLKGISNANTNFPVSTPYLISISAFFWSMVNTLIILTIAKLKGARPEVIILSGIISGSLFTAGTSALQYFGNDIQVSSIVFWLFGDMGKTSWNKFWVLLAVTIPATLYFIKNRWNYNALHAGDETAKSLGVKIGKVRMVGMFFATLASAVTVSFFGVIGFVGLVVPHIVRRFIGNDERFLIPASALFGGMFLLFADTVARVILSPVILPVGILTSFIGAPLFIYLLIKNIGRAYND